MDRRLEVNTDLQPVAGSVQATSIPPTWGSSNPSMDRSSAEISPKQQPSAIFRSNSASSDADQPPPEPPQPLSATSSTSSSASGFGWPAPAASRRRRDPFDTARSFSDDPFAHMSSSSSSGDDIAASAGAGAGSISPGRRILPGYPTNASPPVVTEGSWDAAIDRPVVFNRTFSAPLPTRVGSLRQPSRNGSEDNSDPWHSLSLELVDTLQTAIQTLLYVSPPHLLDNAKEQYASCSIQMPATSVSALFTSMRGLNYLSANLVPLIEGRGTGIRTVQDFDVGELLQNVADQLSGEAAQAEVDLVLFHGDVGMKHVSVTGDREGIGYTIGHIVRQVLLVADKNDTIEFGLQIIPQDADRRVSLPVVAADFEDYRRQQASQSEGSANPRETIQCVFEIVHNVSMTAEANAVTPKAELNPFSTLAEQREASTPKLETLLCNRLLRQINGRLKTNTVPSSPTGFGHLRYAYELSIELPRGRPIAEPTPLSAEEELHRQPYRDLVLPREPTLVELAEFAETLRGRRVHLHASLTSIFARHLTSYLAAWGLDVSHISVEDESTFDENQGLPKFILIDEDLGVLRRELLRVRSDTHPHAFRQRTMKRPALIRSVKSTSSICPPSLSVIIHFTSIDKYRQVRDVVATHGFPSQPEVIVIPKPVGPRRFLTALFTAVKQPLVDPAFSPIATSPRSPHVVAGARTPTAGAVDGFFDAVDALQSDLTPQIGRSPRGEFPPQSNTRPEEPSRLSMPTPNDLISKPASEYFSRSTSGSSKSASGASGVIMQSPDGRPYGMFFEPPPSSHAPSQRNEESDGAAERPSAEGPVVNTVPPSPLDSPTGGGDRRPSTMSSLSGTTDESPSLAEVERPSTSGRRRTLPVLPGTRPIVAHGRNRSSTITRRLTNDSTRKLPEIEESIPRQPKPFDVVVPPINVLIVEDNPINQNILSMFFRKKKIKHQTAKDGLEAVEKWRTGSFHLILMDIQLPVMDGIAATKEIRKMEKNNKIGVFPSTPMSESSRTAEALPAASPFRSAVIIVALTASSLQTDRVNALAAGCNDFLTKPVSLKWLEKKTVEWGCMQALIDFDGWRRSKAPERAEMHLGFDVAPKAAARDVASRLHIQRDKVRPKPGQSSAQSTPAPTPNDTTPAETPSRASPVSSTPPLPPAKEAPERPAMSDPPSSVEKPLPALPTE